LTKDGEKIGHERVSRMLGKALQAGIKTFVIPGNHDIRNPFAKYFDGDKTSPAEGITAEEFASIYHDFGYADDYLRDPNSLSYVCEPIPGLTLLAVDASQYEKNTYIAHGDTRDESIVGGAIKPNTLDWLLAQADEAKGKGNQVIAMMHQQLIDHADKLEEIDNTTTIENGDSIAQLMMEHGIHVVFTGHTHWSDASTTWNSNHTNSLTDITTGSTIAYPAHYRVVTVSDDCSRLNIDTYRITSLPSQPDYTQFGRQFFENGTEAMTYTLARTYWPTIEPTMKAYCQEINLGFASVTFNLPTSPDDFANLAYKYLESFLKEAWLTVQEGNEHDQDAYDRLSKELRKGVYKIFGKIIENDIYILGKPMARSEARDLVMRKATPMLMSLLEDLTHVGTENEDRTDDLHLNIDLGSGKILTDSELARIIPVHLDESAEVRIYNMQGQLVTNQHDSALPAGCYIVITNGIARKVSVTWHASLSE
jgi:UDP-2,3-diacylglucosamine pyrophosphatase LpxH